jgi:hypothetical protein
MSYIILGFGYIYFKYISDLMPDFWSPMQPFAMICIWPLVGFADLIRWINKVTKP